MILSIQNNNDYNLIEESKIETVCGALYQAMDLRLGRTVAVKQIHIEGKDPREKQQNYRAAFSEVQVMIRAGEENINVPRILDVYYDSKSSELFIIMEWIKGNTLRSHMGAPLRDFLRWMLELCEILIELEKKRIYHKDIKPENIMISNRGVLYLIDYNISASTPNLLEGTLHYRAPEMMMNSRYPGREKVDMFAIGVMLYEYLTGAVPVHTQDYAKNRQRGEFAWDLFTEPKEKNPEISERLNRIIVKCMKLDPKQRFRDARDLRNELQQAYKECRWTQKKQ